MKYGNKCCEVSLGAEIHKICTNTTLVRSTTLLKYVPIWAPTYHGWRINENACFWTPLATIGAMKIMIKITAGIAIYVINL